MKNEKQNIGLAVQPYVEGCFHSTNTLACCFMPTYAKSGVRHLFNEGIYSEILHTLKTAYGVKHLFNEGIYSFLAFLFNKGIYSFNVFTAIY